MLCCILLVLLLIILFVTLLLLLRSKEEVVVDDFDPWPLRLVVRTTDPAVCATELLPPAIAAVLLRSNKLGASRLEVLEFENMESLRVIARKLFTELGSRALPFFASSCRPAFKWPVKMEWIEG
jgi:hypothetical protein